MSHAHIKKVFAVTGSGNEIPSRLPTRDTAPSDATVVRSWQRCMTSYGLEPHHTPPPSILTRTELKDVRAPIDDLICVARGEIDRLFTHVGPNDYVVLLTDMRGVTVDFRCSTALIDRARHAGLYLGSIWAENEQGTNGVGTCLYETKPLSIVMDEHFSTRNTALTCTVSPIFAAEGHLMGILDISTARATDHANQLILRQIVAEAAQRIENIYFDHRHAAHTVLRLSRLRDFADSATETRLAISESGIVLEAGNNAARILGAEGMVANHKLSQLLDLPLPRLLGAGGPLEVRTARGDSLFVRIDAKKNPGGARSHSTKPKPLPVKSEVPTGERPRYDLQTIAGQDPAMLANADVARRLIDRGLPILLAGETGSGKGLFAHALHACSDRRCAPFVTINCAAIPPELIESELFGYRPGAFTGASTEGFKGRLMQANTGTLFLDEIGDMPLPLQTRLLQVLSDREFTPIGATAPIKLDIAVISATLHNLAERVRAGQFREDLFFRLSGVTIALPPLRQRRDRAALIRRIFQEEADRVLTSVLLHDSTIAVLCAYFWPGNLRELRHMACLTIALTEGQTDIYPQHLPPPFGNVEQSNAADSKADAVEAQMLKVALERTGWNVSATAALLDISRATLHRKIRKHGLHRH